MKKNIICLAFICMLVSCCKKNSHKFICYENKAIVFQMDKKEDTTCEFELSNKKTGEKIYGKAYLILLDGIVPECGLVEDYDNPNEISGYQCDSTYLYIDSNLNISFAFELYNRERMDLEIWQSAIEGFSVGGHTLRKLL